jgi:hypothetical protein
MNLSSAALSWVQRLRRGGRHRHSRNQCLTTMPIRWLFIIFLQLINPASAFGGADIRVAGSAPQVWFDR